MEATLNKILPELKLKENETLVLFLNDNNGWNKDDKYANLVIVENYDSELVQKQEKNIPGVYHRGGNWEEALLKSRLKYKLLLKGKESDFTDIIEKYFDFRTYNVISGTY